MPCEMSLAMTSDGQNPKNRGLAGAELQLGVGWEREYGDGDDGRSGRSLAVQHGEPGQSGVCGTEPSPWIPESAQSRRSARSEPRVSHMRRMFVGLAGFAVSVCWVQEMRAGEGSVGGAAACASRPHLVDQWRSRPVEGAVASQNAAQQGRACAAVAARCSGVGWWGRGCRWRQRGSWSRWTAEVGEVGFACQLAPGSGAGAVVVGGGKSSGISQRGSSRGDRGLVGEWEVGRGGSVQRGVGLWLGSRAGEVLRGWGGQCGWGSESPCGLDVPPSVSVGCKAPCFGGRACWRAAGFSRAG